MEILKESQFSHEQLKSFIEVAQEKINCDIYLTKLNTFWADFNANTFLNKVKKSSNKKSTKKDDSLKAEIEDFMSKILFQLAEYKEESKSQEYRYHIVCKYDEDHTIDLEFVREEVDYDYQKFDYSVLVLPEDESSGDLDLLTEIFKFKHLNGHYLNLFWTIVFENTFPDWFGNFFLLQARRNQPIRVR